RAVCYGLFMCIGSMLFSVLWVQTSGMDARSVAEQIQGIGMQIPGFRRDPRIIEQVLARYITPLAIMGGLFVGLLAAFADFTGALGSGTGILLTVMIIYNFYEQISMRYMEDMHPALRGFFE
ncbi:MAG: preprotein translocase subunit SecY, partial [Candidatus Aenigmatarchaeota archaeon]